MNVRKSKSKWPKPVQGLVKVLVRLVLKEDLDLLVSNSVANKFRVDQLWAAGARAYLAYGVKRDTIEWLDLHDALVGVKPLPALDQKSSTPSVKPQPETAAGK